MKKTIWQPLLIGTLLGLLAGVTTVTGLSFLTPGITDNAIGFYATLFLLSAALGGPLAGIIAPILFIVITAAFGQPDMKEILGDPDIFWSNLLAMAITVALVGLAYRYIFVRLRMPARLLAWAGIVLLFYALSIPSSVAPQYLLHGNPVSEILTAVRYGYQTYLPQAIFDIVITSLFFIALPARYLRPRWIEPHHAASPVEDSPLSKELHQ